MIREGIFPFCPGGKNPSASPFPGPLSESKPLLLGGSWVAISRVRSRITIIVITHIEGLVAPLKSAHEPPSKTLNLETLLKLPRTHVLNTSEPLLGYSPTRFRVGCFSGVLNPSEFLEFLLVPGLQTSVVLV